MTVSVPGQLVYSYSGDGSTQIFSYPVRFLDEAELVVVLEASDGTQTVKTLTTHYTVSGAGEANGGSVTMLTAPSAGETLYIYRSTAATQSVDLTDNNRSPAATVEEQLDRFALGLQDLKESARRTYKTPAGATDKTIEVVAEGHFLKADASGNLVDGGSATDISEAQTNAAAAAASASAAASSATAAASSATAAAFSATDASTSATEAAASAASIDPASIVHKADTDASTFGFVLDDDDTLAGASAQKLALSKNVKAYVDNRILVPDTIATDDGAAINTALGNSKRVFLPAGTYGVGTKIEVPNGVILEMDPNAILKPTLDIDVLQVHAGGWVSGGQIDTRDNATWASAAIDIDGDDEGGAQPFRLHIRSGFSNIVLWGKTGSGSGTAIKVHADGATNARIMGVKGEARVYGFENALWLRQTSSDTTKFVTSCEFRVQSSSSWRCLKMDAVSNYNLDGNKIWLQHQPDTSTTVSAVNVHGQYNEIYAFVWDWSDIYTNNSNLAAVVIDANARYNRVGTAGVTYVTDNSGNHLNSILSIDRTLLGTDVFVQGTFHPPQPNGAKSTVALYVYSGTPPDANGASGDICLSYSGVAGKTLWRHNGTAWVSVV